DLGVGEVRLQELGGRRAFVVELGDLSVALRVVVVGVDDDLVADGICGHAAIALERYGDDDDVPLPRRVFGGAGSSAGAEVGDEVPEGVGATRVADHDVVAVGQCRTRHAATDVARADDPECRHAVANAPDRDAIPSFDPS